MLKDLIRKDKNKKILIASSLLIFVSVITYPLATERILITTGDIEKYLSSKDYYEKILDYTNYSMGNLNITFVERYRDDVELVSVYKETDNDMEKLRKIVNSINEYSYNDLQNDPKLLSEYGGNCQAKTLLADQYFNQLGWESDIVTEPGHMYNKVKVDGSWYTLDLTYNTLERMNNKNE